REPMTSGIKNTDYVDIDKIAEATDGMSGADVASIANTAVSLVIHEFLDKYPDQKEAEKQATEAKVTMRHFEEAVRKVKTQKELKIGEKVAVPYYR
ncbi:MAG: AAA family ATPase, partial [Thaumarchaeota archaeon]|nr:AAA family ATPase [Nitrososphaerota archaeon]